MSSRLNRKPILAICYDFDRTLSPDEFKSTWLGNKAVYRTRMAMADGGELIILAPGVERFGEDEQVDRLIRKYGYKGRLKTLEEFRKTESYARRVGLTEFIIGIVLLSLFITGVGYMIFGNSKNTIGKTITDFESINLRLRGMRVTEEYEIVTTGETAEIYYYNMFYGNGEEERRLVKKTVCETQTVIDTLNGFGFAGWDGFVGERPRGLLDGTDFRLTAVVNGGQKMNAQGSASFPKNFHEFEQWLYDILNNAE